MNVRLVMLLGQAKTENLD